MNKNYEKTLKTKRGWTKIPNAIRHDENLTSDAKVVIEELLSVSGDFNISMKGIAKATHLSESKVKRAVDLLQDTGYLKIVKIRNGKYFGGYKWLISDVPGVYRKCTDGISMDGISIPATSDYGISNNDISIPATSIGAPLYQYTERYQHTNNQKRIDQHTDECQLPHHQAQAQDEEEVSPPPYQFPSFSSGFSSEATASPLQGKKPGYGEEVISQREYQFQQYLKKYPKKPNGSEMEATKQAFLEAVSTDEDFTEIMAGLDAWCSSVDWTKENGRYITKPLYFLTTRKWEEIPMTINTDIKEELLQFMRGNTEDCV